MTLVYSSMAYGYPTPHQPRSILSDVAGTDDIVVNPETGEIVGVVVRNQDGKPPRPSTRMSTPYVMIFIPGLARAAKDHALVGTDYRVLLYVCSQAPLAVTVWDASPQTIGKALRIDRQRVSLSLRRLINRGYLTRPARGKIAFSTSFAWRGTARDRETRMAIERGEETDA